jgi:vacuolar-type H+-ATPase subunit I/STV1
MSIKITEQNNSILVRRWVYTPERKRSMPTTIMSIANWKIPKTFTLDQIKEFGITHEERLSYEKYVEGKNIEDEKQNKIDTAKSANIRISNVIVALSDPEAVGGVSDEEIEKLSETVNELKKLVTSTKSKRKRKTKTGKKPAGLTVNIG